MKCLFCRLWINPHTIHAEGWPQLAGKSIWVGGGCVSRYFTVWFALFLMRHACCCNTYSTSGIGDGPSSIPVEHCTGRNWTEGKKGAFHIFNTAWGEAVESREWSSVTWNEWMDAWVLAICRRDTNAAVFKLRMSIWRADTPVWNKNWKDSHRRFFSAYFHRTLHPRFI